MRCVYNWKMLAFCEIRNCLKMPKFRWNFFDRPSGLPDPRSGDVIHPQLRVWVWVRDEYNSQCHCHHALPPLPSTRKCQVINTTLNVEKFNCSTWPRSSEYRRPTAYNSHIYDSGYICAVLSGSTNGLISKYEVIILRFLNCEGGGGGGGGGRSKLIAWKECMQS